MGNISKDTNTNFSSKKLEAYINIKYTANWINSIENEFKLLIANGITTARNMAEYIGQDHIKIRNLAKTNAIYIGAY